MAELPRSEEHTSELQSLIDLVCRLLLEKKKKKYNKRLCGSSSVQQLSFHAVCAAQTSSKRRVTPSPAVCSPARCLSVSFFFFLNDTAPPEIYPFPLPAALPI